MPFKDKIIESLHWLALFEMSHTGLASVLQSVGSIKVFLTEFQQRLMACFTQEWNASLDIHHFYSVYSSSKREVKNYIY